MLDPARLTERHEFYFDLLPRLAEWGFNTLWWHFVDDEGFVLKLDAHPELASPHAFSKAQMRRLVRLAAELGIDVVPEVECLGHARYITRLPQYAHLQDGDAHHFNAVCPSNPDTTRLLREVIEETADVFPSPYFHAGLDEVDLSGCRRCRRKIARMGHWRLFAGHVGALHRIITGCGKRMIMWADHVEREPRVLKAIPKDVILAHWHYGRVNVRRDFERSLEAGFEIIGASSMLRHGNVIMPHRSQMENTEGMAAEARRLARRGMLGAVNTWWTPRRILRDAALPLAAYTGHLFAGGQADLPAGEAGRAAFFGGYARRRFDLAGKTVGDAINMLHEQMLLLTDFKALAFDSPADMLHAAAAGASDQRQEQARKLRGATDCLAGAAGKVKMASREYKALVLAGQVACRLIDNGKDLARAVDCYRKAEDMRDRGYEPARAADLLDQAGACLAGIASRLDVLCREVSAEWDRTRHPGDVKKALRPVTDPCPADSLLGRLVRSREFVRSLHRALAAAVKAYRRGGPFPVGV